MSAVSVTLLVTGEDLDPEFVTRSLLHFPDQSWKRGEVPPAVRERVSDGKPSEWGGWKKFIQADFEERSLEDQIAYWTSLLRDRSSGIALLCAEGYELVLDCYIEAASPTLVELSDSLISNLGALHLRVDLHIFRFPDEG